MRTIIFTRALRATRESFALLIILSLAACGGGGGGGSPNGVTPGSAAVTPSSSTSSVSTSAFSSAASDSLASSSMSSLTALSSSLSSSLINSSSSARHTDQDGDGSPDAWAIGCDLDCQAASGLVLDGFPDNPAASIDADGDGSPDRWSASCNSSCQFSAGLHLDKFPNNVAASLDADNDGSPDAWNTKCNLACQANSGLTLDPILNGKVASKIEIRVPVADDWVYLSVNGFRHRVAYWGQPETMNEWRDISAWFSPGDNKVRLHAVNASGPRGLQFQMRLDGILLTSVNCPSLACPDGTQPGTFYESSIEVPSLVMPRTGSLTVKNSVEGKIYVNDEYISLSAPATLALPKGIYKIGIGVSNDNPQDLTDHFYESILALGVPSQYNLAGSFYEKTVTISEGSSQTLVMDAVSAPLPPQNTVKIAILPFQSVMSKDMSSPLVMTQAMLDGFAEQVKVTGDRLATPSMYGLSKWEVTVLPWDTILNINANNVQALVDELYSVSWRPEYQHLFDAYDTVIIYQSSYHADGTVEPIFAGGMTTSGRLIHVTSGWTWTLPSNAVNRGLYHEMYHQYEFWETGNHHYYNGIGGLHGERLHGFIGGGASVQEYYRLFVRGQAGESYAAREGFDWPSPLVNGEPFPVGVFHAVRYGRLPPQ